MENNKSSLRNSVSFLVSMILHSSAIAVIALGPAILQTQSGGGENEKLSAQGEQVEFTIAESTPLSQVTLPRPIQAISVNSKKVSNSLPEKQKVEAIEPQPIVEMKDDTAVEAAESTIAVVVATQAQPEQQVQQEPVAVAQVNETQIKETLASELQANEVQNIESDESETNEPQSVVVAQETKKAETAEPLPAPKIVATSSGSATEATTAVTGGDSSASTTAAAPAVIQVQQTFAGLKQLPGNQPPTYTRDMRLKQVQGKGQLVYFVTKEGRVTNLRLTQSTGHSELDMAAVSAFSKYKFVGGQEGYTVHDFEFSLKGPAVTDAGRLRTTMRK